MENSIVRRSVAVKRAAFICRSQRKSLDQDGLCTPQRIPVGAISAAAPWIGHPIASFNFGDSSHVAFSIDAGYKAGQSYSAILGFFRQYALIFIVADERDVIRLRTNYRTGEEVCLYRTKPPTGASAGHIPHLCRLAKTS